MKVIIDTNVLISGIFWLGPPKKVLGLWKTGDIQLVISLDILDEYHRIAKRLSTKYPLIDIHSILELISMHSLLVETPKTYSKITADPDDDKFMVCAETSNTKIVISGDKHLLDVDGHMGIEVLQPKVFIEKYFSK